MAIVSSESLSIGWEAVDFLLPDVNGQKYSLSDFEEKEALLIVFTCNHCPYAQAAWPLLAELHNEFGDDVDFLAINSNDAEQYPEDGVEGMKAIIEEHGIEFPYVIDESQSVAHDYEAQCTPDVYLFNKGEEGFELYYHGRINDNWQDPELVEERNLEEAIAALLNGAEPPMPQQPSMGCSIKWK